MPGSGGFFRAGVSAQPQGEEDQDGDASHSHAVEGCGLGLSIARWITTTHGGTIQFTSSPNQITTATVRLPLAL